MSLRTVDAVLTGQSLVAGRISDSLTGRAVAGRVEVSLEIRVSSQPELRPFPVQLRMLAGGYFRYAGEPALAFPPVEAPETLELRLRVSAAGYDDAQVDFSLSAADVAAVEEDTNLVGHDVAVPTFPALP